MKPENIIMCDASSWGVFWNAIGSNVPLYISEGYAFNDKAIKLDFNGAKGGISGKHKITYTEYLNSVYAFEK